MSKSIYDEAIELINLNILPRESGKTSKRKVIHALRQAQKQEKLLNKIKDIINRPDDSYISSMLEESKRYVEIIKLIKELENNEK